MAIAALSQLDDYKLVDKNQDIRGWTLQDAGGRPLGEIRELMVDTDAERVTTVVLADGTEHDVRDIRLGDRQAVLEAAAPGAGQDEMRLPVMEERLQVSKRQVDQGAVRVQTHVTERPVEESVQLREEQVRVGRYTADRPASAADLQRAQQHSVEVIERAEVPVVAKEARVVEEVVVRKEVGERSETVRDTLRRADVAVETLPSTSQPPRRS